MDGSCSGNTRIYISLNANNIALVFDSDNIVNISGNIFSCIPLKAIQYYINICDFQYPLSCEFISALRSLCVFPLNAFNYITIWQTVL